MEMQDLLWKDSLQWAEFKHCSTVKLHELSIMIVFKLNIEECIGWILTTVEIKSSFYYQSSLKVHSDRNANKKI